MMLLLLWVVTILCSFHGAHPFSGGIESVVSVKMRKLNRIWPGVMSEREAFITSSVPTTLMMASSSSNGETSKEDYLSSLSNVQGEQQKTENSDAHDREEMGSDQQSSLKSKDEGAFRKLRKRLFGGSAVTKANLAKMGRSMFLSYGFVSNASGSIAVAASWFIASKRSGLSPLAPGQWKSFMAIYAGFYAFLNIIRPARFALAVAISKYFDQAINLVKKRFQCSAARATFLVVLIVNICGSTALFSLGIATASMLSGVPIWAGR